MKKESCDSQQSLNTMFCGNWKIFCAILALVCGHVCASEEFDQGDISDSEETLVQFEEFDEDEDEIKTSEKESDEDEDVDSTEGRIEQQKKLLKEKKSGKNYNELKVLHKGGFVVTKGSLADLEKKFNNAVTKVNLFEPSNLKAAVRLAFDFAMDEDAETNFISKEDNIAIKIKSNEELYSAIQAFVDNLNDPEEAEKDILVKNLQKLEEIYSILEEDENIGEKNVFSKFVKGMIKLYQVCIARETADKIMEEYRNSAENKFISTRKSSSVGAGGVANMGGAKLGVSASVHKDEGSDDSSFYTVSVGGGIRFSVGAGLSKIGAELGLGADVTKSAVFFSLEQLLDSGKIKTGVLSEKSIKKTLKSRKKMQDRERELLSIFGKDIEGYLKMIGVIPVSTYLEWPKLTKASPADEATNKSKSIDSTVFAFEMLGFNVVANDDIKTWRRPSGYMTLVSEDCSPSDGLSANDIVEFLGKQYNRLDRLEEELQDQDKKRTKKLDKDKQLSLQEFLEKGLEAGASERIAYNFVLTTILGDIRAYNSALNILAKNKSDKKAEQRKHEIEKRWLPKHKFTSEGRLGVLKSMIATAVVLKKGAITDKENELFRQFHSEMSRLAQMLEFSKNKSSRGATFMTETTAHNIAIQASASVAIPRFGDAQFSINRSWVRDNPLQDENGDCMSIDIVLPLTPVGIVGTGVVHRSLNGYRRLMGQSPASGFGNTFELTQDGFDLVQDNMMIPEVQDLDMAGSVSGSAIITASLCRSDASDPKSMENIRPLPGREDVIQKAKNEWMVWYYKGAAYLNSGIEKNFELADIGYSSSVGRETIIIGTDTFGYLTSRFNAFSLGLKDSKQALSPWYAFKNKHKKRLTELLENIADDESNIIYELQGMYNTIMDDLENDDTESSKCSKLFEDFISACNKLSEVDDEESEDKDEDSENEESKDDEENTVDKRSEDETPKGKAFKKASKLLDQVLQMNFEHNFLVNYNSVYKIKK